MKAVFEHGEWGQLHVISHSWTTHFCVQESQIQYPFLQQSSQHPAKDHKKWNNKWKMEFNPNINFNMSDSVICVIILYALTH